MVFRVGITGHRFLTDIEKLTNALELVYQELTSRFQDHTFELYSGLAEGADRLAASIFCEHDIPLHAVLPMPAEIYENDFSSKASVDEFHQLLNKSCRVITLSQEERGRPAYQKLGEFLLNHCDLIICIWDGKPSDIAGSTGYIATTAILKKMQVVWIHAGNRIPKTNISTSLYEEQGKIDYYNF